MQLHAGQQQVRVQKATSSGLRVIRAPRVAPRRPAVRRLAVRAAAVNGKVVCVGEALFGEQPAAVGMVGLFIERMVC